MSVATTTYSMPRIGDRVPEFEAMSTQGPIKSSDFSGKWTLFFSHPADFTPVCTTEFVEFAKRADEFKQRGVQLVGLSVDSVPSHLAWLRNIEEKLGVQVPFPVIADLDMAVSQKFGMIHPGASATATVRAVFIIDPNLVIRAIVYYPLSNGRNIDELLRLVDALQTTDKHKVSTPANWRPGDKVIVPPPQTMDEVKERLSASHEDMVDFYLLRKSI
jgi:peroxiredoxin (alkyl hydroperoxide reductase subunit C)